MLIQCPECKQQVSEQAASCPTCGRPLSEDDRSEDYRARAKAAAETKLKTSMNNMLGCMMGCAVVAGLFIAALFIIGSLGRDGRRDDSSPTPTLPVLGAEYVVTGTDIGLMDSPKFYYPDPVEFAQHVVLILLPGDVIVPQGYAGLARLQVRVATHNGKAVYVVGYMPFEFITGQCRLKNPQP